MASRTKQKEEARARRLAEEQAAAERARRTRRLQMLGGVLIAAVAVIVVAIAISSSGGGSSAPTSSAQFKSNANTVASQLAGIPQSGNTLGSASAPVTVTEFGDLQCPICRDFALGSEQQLIAGEVKQGKAKIVYKSLETATGNSPNPSIFPTQQAAAYAAGPQQKAWNYILTFYHSQGAEGSGYVTQNFLNGIAAATPGLNYNTWKTASTNPTYTQQVAADEQQAASKGFNSTPTIVVSGPKGQAQPIVGDTDYGTLQSAIKQVQ